MSAHDGRGRGARGRVSVCECAVRTCMAAAAAAFDGAHVYGSPGTACRGIAARRLGPESAAGMAGGMYAATVATHGDGSHSSFLNRVNDAVVGSMTGGHALPAAGAGAAAGGQAKRAGVGKDVAGMTVLADKPHSAWWRSLRGALAVAGAAFIAVQIMRLKGRPVGVPLGVPDGVGWGAAGGPGVRVSRRSGQTIAHGHHSFHQRPAAMV